MLKKLGLHSLGRPARGHLLLTKTLLIVGQERGTHREGDGPKMVPDFEIATRHYRVSPVELRGALVANSSSFEMGQLPVQRAARIGMTSTSFPLTTRTDAPVTVKKVLGVK